ncbi:cytochrome c-type biogenesis protein CcmH [SAR86 cluster bacterium]|nr:cytochrome c-type biogenesis protein CcmH [SAR86 cluster bacterium]
MIKLLISLLFISALSFAETNLFSFESEAQKNLFDELTYEIGCPLCAGSNVSGSSAPIALDIKDFIYMEISKGKTKSEIKDQVASKFGDDVLFSPPRNLSTLLLYIFPLILVFLALLALFKIKHK